MYLNRVPHPPPLREGVLLGGAYLDMFGIMLTSMLFTTRQQMQHVPDCGQSTNKLNQRYSQVGRCDAVPGYQ